MKKNDYILKLQSIIKDINPNNLKSDIEIINLINNSKISTILDEAFKDVVSIPRNEIYNLTNNKLLTRIIINYIKIKEILIIDEIDEQMGNISSFKLYINDVNKYPLLTKDEEYKLAQKNKLGDKNARNKLIESNLRYVVKVANNYKKRGVSFLDIIQSGNMGLTYAVDKFDPEKGCRLCTYAHNWIEKEIKSYIYNKGRIIRIPIQKELMYYNILKVINTLEKEKGEYTISDIKKITGYNEEDIQKLLKMTKWLVSTQSNINDEKKLKLEDLIEDKNYVDPYKKEVNNELAEEIENILNDSGLKSRDIEILKLRVGLCSSGRIKTCEEIGKIYGISRKRISQIEKECLKKIKRNKNINRLSEFL